MFLMLCGKMERAALVVRNLSDYNGDLAKPLRSRLRQPIRGGLYSIRNPLNALPRKHLPYLSVPRMTESVPWED